MLRKAWFVFGVALSLGLAPDLRAQDAAEPWGYVYSFATARVYPLVKQDSRLGRLAENDVSLTSTRVSRRHAALQNTEDGPVFVDIGSSNGSRVNGVDVRSRLPVAIASGDRIQLADELLLFHTTLASLWDHELKLRLLGSLISLKLDMPRDYTRKSLGREQLNSVTTIATLNTAEGHVEVDYLGELDPEAGFGTEEAAFVGNVALDDGVLELSLWGLDDGGRMTSRRSSISRLKHTTLRVAMETVQNSNPAGDEGPWFPQGYLVNLFELLPVDRDLSVRFSRSLAEQERPLALRDAAETLYFRHQLSSDDLAALVLAVRSKSGWIEATCIQKKMSLTEVEKGELKVALDSAREWLEQARRLGAKGKEVADADAVVGRAGKRLEALDQQ